MNDLNPVPGTDHLISAAYPALGGPFQALLWIPEFSGNRTAFCSRNVKRKPVFPDEYPKHAAKPNDIYSLMSHDDNGASRCAPFENATNPNCGTPYFIEPISRSLTCEELTLLGEAVAARIGKAPGHYDDPIRALRSDHLAALREELKIRNLIPS